MDNNVEEIKSKLDIVDVISEYIQLRPAGVNFRALCPFHQEKTPSFFVSSERQIWHCFGACNEGGDIFKFVMKIEGVDFPEALRILANKAGVTLKKSDPQLISQRTKILDILSVAADFYYNILTKNPLGKPALDYLKKRGLSDKTIEEFQLGFVYDKWDSLLNFLTQKGFKLQDIEAAGLIISRISTNPRFREDKFINTNSTNIRKISGSICADSRGYYDRFRARIMFPLQDTHGSVVGFTARVLRDDEKSAKYVNTPETLVYSKSRILYGLDKAKSEIRKNDMVVVVEGQMDVLTSHQAGVKNVVASSGTALTLEQIKLLKRYTSNLILGFDIDLAGQEATKRGIDLVLQQEMNVKVITLLKGKDPDECIRENLSLWKEGIKKAKPVMEYYFDSTFSLLDITKVENKKKAASILLLVINKIANKIEQDYWLKELTQKLGVNETAVRETLKRIQDKRMGEFSLKTPVKKEEKDKSFLLGEKFLALILRFSPNFPSLWEKYFLPLKIEILSHANLKDLANCLLIYYNNKRSQKDFSFKCDDFLLTLKEKHLREYVDFLILLAEKEFSFQEEKEIKEELQKIIRYLKKEYWAKQLKRIEQDLRIAEQKKVKEDIEKLSHELNKITKELAKDI